MVARHTVARRAAVLALAVLTVWALGVAGAAAVVARAYGTTS